MKSTLFTVHIRAAHDSTVQCSAVYCTAELCLVYTAMVKCARMLGLCKVGGYFIVGDICWCWWCTECLYAPSLVKLTTIKLCSDGGTC